jgi:hypothetical protein
VILWACFSFLVWVDLSVSGLKREEKALEGYFGDAWRNLYRRKPSVFAQPSSGSPGDADQFQWARYKKTRNTMPPLVGRRRGGFGGEGDSRSVNFIRWVAVSVSWDSPQRDEGGRADQSSRARFSLFNGGQKNLLPLGSVSPSLRY